MVGLVIAAASTVLPRLDGVALGAGVPALAAVEARGAHFHGDTTFAAAYAADEVILAGARFHGPFTASDSVFAVDVDVRGTHCAGFATWLRARFRGNAAFSRRMRLLRRAVR